MAVPLSEAMVCQATVLETYRFLIALAEINCSNFFVLGKREILDRFSNASTEENVMDIGRPPLSVHQ